MEKDEERGLELYLEAVGLDVVLAMLYAGVVYSNQGKYDKAMEMYTMAADKGVSSAMFYIGEFYELGLGVEVNLDTAAHWYSRAGDLGHTGAQQKLQTMVPMPV